MKQNQPIIGKECTIEQIFPQLPATKKLNGIDVKSIFNKLKDVFAEVGLSVVDAHYDIDKNTICIECDTKAYTPMKGLILDVQEDMAIIALKDIHEECTFFTAKDDTPKGAYMPEAWEMVKYCTHLQKYWPIKYRYWTSSFYYQTSYSSYLCLLTLYSDYCSVDYRSVDRNYHLFAGYFIKVPLKQLHIIK